MEPIKGDFLFIEISGWNSNIKFSSTHLLPEHERCGVLHGHTYAINAKITGDVDKNGFIIDFTKVKSDLRKIANNLDHKILIPEKNRFVVINEKEILIDLKNKKYIFPKEDCVILPLENITAENLAIYVIDQYLKISKLPKNIKSVEIGMDESIGQGARIIKNIG